MFSYGSVIVYVKTVVYVPAGIPKNALPAAGVAYRKLKFCDRDGTVAATTFCIDSESATAEAVIPATVGFAVGVSVTLPMGIKLLPFLRFWEAFTYTE